MPPAVVVPTYKRPPITEAVIELRFAQQFSEKTIEKAASRLRKEYAHSEKDHRVDIMLDVDAQKSQFVPSPTGERLSSQDRADVTIFRPEAFVSSRLAPYCGWEVFIARVRRDWEVWRGEAGAVKLTRIGVRYINRIDIPIPGPAEDTKIQLKDFVNVWPHTPTLDWGPLANFAFQAIRPLNRDECYVRLYSGTIESPLLGHAALALDLDIFRESALPMRDDELWTLLGRMRELKNYLFESCITDRSRELFNR
jgi:uncharacterized protein (TIGR04255 family)